MIHSFAYPLCRVAVASFLTVLLGLAGPVDRAFAQIDAVDTTEPDVPGDLEGWDMEWRASITGSQSAYSNWSKGGVNTLSILGNSTIRLFYKIDRYALEARIETRYGKAMVQDDGVRKTDDRLRIRNRMLYDLSREDAEFKLFGNINMDTQFSRGYRYGELENGGDLLVSDFLAPAYLMQNSGIAYYPDGDFSVEAGLGMRQTIVRDSSLSERYGLNEGQRFRNEGGFTLGAWYEVDVMENVAYSGYLESFTNLLEHVRKTNIAIGHELVGRINSHIRAVFQLELIFDEDQSKRWQLSQSLSAGLSINIR